MVSSTLCPAVHILGSQNVYSRAEGIADHYWPWTVFLVFHEVKDLPCRVGHVGWPDKVAWHANSTWKKKADIPYSTPHSLTDIMEDQ